MRKNLILLSNIAIAFAISIAFSNCSSRKITSGNVPLIYAAGQGKPYFLFLSDVHLAANRATTDYGEDAGTTLWETFRIKIGSIVDSTNPPFFILYTGDMPEHGGSSNPYQRDINIKDVLSDLQQMSAAKNIPLFYLPGNNDALAGNYCFFTDDNGQNAFSLIQQYSPYPYQAFNVSKTFASNSAYMISSENLASGYYSAKITKGLRMISLNSVIWSSQLCYNCNADCQPQSDTGQQQMNWFTNQLQNAADSGDKVYIAMHIPPGIDAYLSSNNPSNPTYMWQNDARWQNQFLKAIALYKQTVAGIFYGHTHMDEFRMLYGDSLNNTISQVAISCPGVSTRNYNNPGFKLVTIDEATKLPVNSITHYVTLKPLKWQQPYPFLPPSGSTVYTSIYEALSNMSAADRKKLLQSIYAVKYKNTPAFYSLGLDVMWLK